MMPIQKDQMHGRRDISEERARVSSLLAWRQDLAEMLAQPRMPQPKRSLLAPIESWGDRSQNRLQDVRIVINT